MEDSKSLKTFFYSEDKIALGEKIKSILNKPNSFERVEKFKMEDTIKTVYDSFYT